MLHQDCFTLDLLSNIPLQFLQTTQFSIRIRGYSRSYADSHGQLMIVLVVYLEVEMCVGLYFILLSCTLKEILTKSYSSLQTSFTSAVLMRTKITSSSNSFCPQDPSPWVHIYLELLSATNLLGMQSVFVCVHVCLHILYTALKTQYWFSLQFRHRYVKWIETPNSE